MSLGLCTCSAIPLLPTTLSALVRLCLHAGVKITDARNAELEAAMQACATAMHLELTGPQVGWKIVVK